MTERLFDRIETLRTEIEAADAGKRAVLITRLEQMVDMLNAKGKRPPAWARGHVTGAVASPQTAEDGRVA